MALAGRAERLFEGLLRLLPQEFRDRHGREIVQVSSVQRPPRLANVRPSGSPRPSGSCARRQPSISRFSGRTRAMRPADWCGGLKDTTASNV